ncbi:MAG TPA: DASH family cryptochrome, partial [bacterium]|nr:DASH family cryptochrome [bacterium]
ASGVAVQAIWQSSLIHPESLPFDISQLPEVFSTFRSRVEKYAVPILAPLAAPRTLPPLPDNFNEDAPSFDVSLDVSPPPEEMRSAFPYFTAACRVDEPGAQAHLAQYLARKLPHTYKATRNALIGIDYSSKWSPFLALGTISARQIMAALRRFEAEHGANEGSYWLWFELLWRDYFRFLHLKHGVRLYRASGLSALPPPTHDAAAFKRWTQGHSGQPFVDAAMRELSATGYLSNRMRQVAASFLIHDLGCDWRAGAAWYESQLIDYDVYSNQGNWLYLAGRGTDPRGGRRFNPHKQAADYDADGRYTALWRDDSPHVRGGMA